MIRQILHNIIRRIRALMYDFLVSELTISIAFKIARMKS